jgi:GNAT superfamily N-acetyltransferase
MIREAEAADLEAVLDVQERANVAALAGISERVPTEAIRERWSVAFAAEGSRVRVFERVGEVMGVTMLTPPWLHALQVVPEAWGTGVAAALHDDALEQMASAREVFLRVIAANHRAVAFWRKHGWETTGLRTTHQDAPHLEILTFSKLLG